MTKIVLTSTSTGQRGQNGKKKVYEIIVSGRSVEVRWGKAEEDQRQAQTKFFAFDWQAQQFALGKKWEKVEKGYVVAYTA